MASDVIKTKIGENMELLIEGLPTSIITPSVQAKTVLSLVKHGIPATGVIGAGILGGIKTATLKIGDETYQIKYSIKVLKSVTAVEIYSEAVDWIDSQKTRGNFDAALADDAIDYLRSEFQREFSSRLNGDSTTDAPLPPKKKKKR